MEDFQASSPSVGVTRDVPHAAIYHNETAGAMKEGNFESRFHMVRDLPGWLNTLSVSHRKSALYGSAGRLTAQNGDFRPCMQRVESEANLLGVVYTEEGVMTAAPYEVLEPEHWVFAGTGMPKGGVFGAASFNERIPGGASGHETDKMSPSSPKNIQLLAKGMNPERKSPPGLARCRRNIAPRGFDHTGVAVRR
jgi:hypothetical protein